jgi:nicotinamidase-related amidase
MTTLQDRPNTALLVVDVQNGVLEGAHERDAVVANVGNLVEKARRERVPGPRTRGRTVTSRSSPTSSSPFPWTAACHGRAGLRARVTARSVTLTERCG